ncbi:MAG TPA: AAA family ATPase [Allocoleopsis sp.]
MATSAPTPNKAEEKKASKTGLGKTGPLDVKILKEQDVEYRANQFESVAFHNFVTKSDIPGTVSYSDAYQTLLKWNNYFSPLLRGWVQDIGKSGGHSIKDRSGAIWGLTQDFVKLRDSQGSLIRKEEVLQLLYVMDEVIGKYKDRPIESRLRALWYGIEKSEYLLSTVESKTFANIELKDPEWLRKNHWQIGALNVLSGRRETGKSTYAMKIASDCSTGAMDGKWKDSPQNVAVFKSPESSDVKAARQLRAYRANIDRVFQYEAPEGTVLQILTEIKTGRLESFVYKHNIKLLIIDPISSYIGDINMNAQNEVRKVLDPLAQLAEKLGICVLMVAHHNKGGAGDVADRVSGSTAFLDVPRVHFALMARKDEETGKDGNSFLHCEKLSEGNKRDVPDYDLDWIPVELPMDTTKGIKLEPVFVLQEKESEETVIDVLTKNRSIARNVEEGKRGATGGLRATYEKLICMWLKDGPGWMFSDDIKKMCTDEVEGSTRSVDMALKNLDQEGTICQVRNKNAKVVRYDPKKLDGPTARKLSEEEISVASLTNSNLPGPTFPL